MRDGATSHVVRDGRRVRSRRCRAATLRNRNACDLTIAQIGGTLALDKYLQMVRQLLAADGPAARQGCGVSVVQRALGVRQPSAQRL